MDTTSDVGGSASSGSRKLSGREDNVLLERSKRGDTAAFEQLVRKYQARMVATLSNYMRNPEDARDVVQEAFVRAYRFMHGCRDATVFSSWLYRIAFNTANDHLARKRRHHAASLDSPEMNSCEEPAALTSYQTPERLVSEAQTKKRVRDAISRLPNTLKTAITLRVFEEQSYEEIASTMDCPIGTVRSRIFRARNALCNDLEFTVGG